MAKYMAKKIQTQVCPPGLTGRQRGSFKRQNEVSAPALSPEPGLHRWPRTERAARPELSPGGEEGRGEAGCPSPQRPSAHPPAGALCVAPTAWTWGADPGPPLAPVRLQARCVFNGSDFLPVQAAVLPPAAPASVAQPGPLRLELRIAKGTCPGGPPPAFSSAPRTAAEAHRPLPADETFGSYFGERDYPLVRRLLEPVPVEVRLLRRTDPRLALVLHRCWAAPGASPFQQPQWPLLSDG